MAAPGSAPIHITLDPASAGAGTDDLLAAMLRANPRISDLVFSPGREVQIPANGNLVGISIPGLRALSADDTRRIASHLIGNNKAAIGMLREQGYCDISYALPGVARFRVNVFIQRGSCAIVMRVIPTSLPNLKMLRVPDELADVLTVRGGIVLATGPRGCGKSSTLAGMVDHINEREACHILTIEDPIEFLHNHKAATVHQRELHSDTPSISHALRAALRQAPNVIAVGELKDNETIALALDAAETGHLVLSTLNTPNASKAIDRMIAAFAASEESVTRERLARTLRCVICQRLIPRKQDGERTAVFQLVTGDALQALLRSAKEAKRGENAISAIDREIERMVRAGLIDRDTGLAHAADPGTLLKNLAGN